MKPSFCEFLRAKFDGRPWCVARRTKRIVERYGEDVVAMSAKKYEALEAEYEALYGKRYERRSA